MRRGHLTKSEGANGAAALAKVIPGRSRIALACSVNSRVAQSDGQDEGGGCSEGN